MKICQVLAGNEDGGLEKHTIELSKQLVNRGFDVTVIAHEDFKESFENIKFIPLDLSKSRNNFFILFKLYKILKKENFDIIHTQANKATSMVTKIKSFIKTKIVSTLHKYKKNLSAFEKSNLVITVSDNIGKNLKTKNKPQQKTKKEEVISLSNCFRNTSRRAQQTFKTCSRTF